MASRSLTYLKSMISRLRGTSNFSTAATPKMKPVSSPINIPPEFIARAKKGDFVPVFVAIGMIMTSTSIGLYTAMKELRHAPDVHLKKSRRETIPEVVEPERVIDESYKYINNSFFRRLANIQGKSAEIVLRQPKAETLKDVGVDPMPH